MQDLLARGVQEALAGKTQETYATLLGSILHRIKISHVPFAIETLVRRLHSDHVAHEAATGRVAQFKHRVPITSSMSSSSTPGPSPPGRPATGPVQKSTTGAHGLGSTMLGARQYHPCSGDRLIKSRLLVKNLPGPEARRGRSFIPRPVTHQPAARSAQINHQPRPQRPKATPFSALPKPPFRVTVVGPSAGDTTTHLSRKTPPFACPLGETTGCRRLFGTELDAYYHATRHPQVP